jgi:hypothetical protein
MWYCPNRDDADDDNRANSEFRPSFRPISPWMAKKSPMRGHMYGEKAKSRQVVVVVFVA